MKIIKTLLNVFILLICVISYSQISIQGYVKSSVTNLKPISSVYIEILNSKKTVIDRTVILDSNRFFKIKSLKANKLYEIKVSAPGYKNQIFKVKSNKGETTTTLTLNVNCKSYSKEQANIDWKNNTPKLLLVGSIAPIANSKADLKFENKFRIKYYDFGCDAVAEECIKIYNERIIELMDINYGMKWRRKVRKDVKYLNL